MKVLKNKAEVNNILFQVLAEAHLNNYNAIYCYNDKEPLEIEEVESLVKPRTYKEVGLLVDMLSKELGEAYTLKAVCKRMLVSRVIIDEEKASILVSSDYFDDRLGYEIEMNGDFRVRICPWADSEFALPFISAYEKWLTKLTGM